MQPDPLGCMCNGPYLSIDISHNMETGVDSHLFSTDSSNLQYHSFVDPSTEIDAESRERLLAREQSSPALTRATISTNQSHGRTRGGRDIPDRRRRITRKSWPIHEICRDYHKGSESHGSTKIQASTDENQSMSPTLSLIRTGGRRGDPFDAFPVENKDIVPEAVDFRERPNSLICTLDTHVGNSTGRYRLSRCPRRNPTERLQPKSLGIHAGSNEA